MPTMREIRLSQDMTQQDLAAKTLLSIAVISRLENGKRIGRPTFLRVCQALNVEPATVTGVNYTIRGGVPIRR